MGKVTQLRNTERHHGAVDSVLTGPFFCWFFFFRYFEDEEEDSSNVELPYIPAENSPTRQQFHSKSADSDSDDDPLEAFMAEVEARPSSCSIYQFM